MLLSLHFDSICLSAAIYISVYYNEKKGFRPNRGIIRPNRVNLDLLNINRQSSKIGNKKSSKEKVINQEKKIG